MLGVTSIDGMIFRLTVEETSAECRAARRCWRALNKCAGKAGKHGGHIQKGLHLVLVPPDGMSQA